jgi:hypothetical protein
MLRHGVVALCLAFISLGIGVIGYHLTEGLSWRDALLNASMIVGGMEPVNELHAVAGNLFVSAYALFSRVAFLVTVGILMTPMVGRLLHRLHMGVSDQ